MRVFKIPENLSAAYHGCGLALAAITGEQNDGAHGPFFVRQWLNTAEAASVVRELSVFGEVNVGMCSALEFVEL